MCVPGLTLGSLGTSSVVIGATVVVFGPTPPPPPAPLFNEGEFGVCTGSRPPSRRVGLGGTRMASKQNQRRGSPVICDPSVLGSVSMSWVLPHGGDGVRWMHVFSQFSSFSWSSQNVSNASKCSFFSHYVTRFSPGMLGKGPSAVICVLLVLFTCNHRGTEQPGPGSGKTTVS